MLNFNYISIFICVVFTNFIGVSLSAQIEVVSERPNAVYQVGEEIHFNITSDYSGQASYSIRLDARSPVLESGTVDFIAGQKVQIAYTHDEPAFLLCEVNGAITTKAGVAVSPQSLEPAVDEPSDFDSFWSFQKSLINNTPIDPNISFYSETGKSTTYRLNLANIEGRRVHGFITIPKGNGPYPAFVTMPSFGSGGGHVFSREFDAEILNSIVVVLSIHNALPDVGDNNAYMPDDYTDQNKNYYRYGLLGGIQAINYLYTRPDFDKVNLGVLGVSQGGGLSICMAGLDQRINLLAASVPALCHHSGLFFDRTSGHPHYLQRSRLTYLSSDPTHEQRAFEATKYFDAVNFAKRYKGPASFFMSYEDEVCPPMTVRTAINKVTGEKVIYHRREAEHSNPDYWEGRFEFIRSYWEKTREPLVSAPNTIGWRIDLEGPTNVRVNERFNISAKVSYDGQERNTSVCWDKHDGPESSVEISASDNGTANIRFTSPGLYTLKVEAADYTGLDNSDLWIELVDYIQINVQ